METIDSFIYEKEEIINRNRGASKFLQPPISAIVSAIDSGQSEREVRVLDAQEVMDSGDKYILPFSPETMI